MASVILPTFEWIRSCEQLARQLEHDDELLVICDSEEYPFRLLERIRQRGPGSGRATGNLRAGRALRDDLLSVRAPQDARDPRVLPRGPRVAIVAPLLVAAGVTVLAYDRYRVLGVDRPT